MVKLCEEIDVKWVSCILILCNFDREYFVLLKKGFLDDLVKEEINKNLEMLDMRCKF